MREKSKNAVLTAVSLASVLYVVSEDSELVYRKVVQLHPQVTHRSHSHSCYVYRGSNLLTAISSTDLNYKT